MGELEADPAGERDGDDHGKSGLDTGEGGAETAVPVRVLHVAPARPRTRVLAEGPEARRCEQGGNSIDIFLA